MTTPHDNSPVPANLLEPIRDVTRQVTRRLRTNLALERLATALFASSLLVAPVLTLWKLGWLDTVVLTATFGTTLASTALWTILAAWAPVDTVAAARRLDRHHQLDDRLSTAMSLIEFADSDTDRGFLRAQIHDAADAAKLADPQAAVPIELPRDSIVASIGMVMLGGLVLVQPPDHTHPMPDPPNITHGVVLDDTSIALARDRLEQLKDDPTIAPDSESAEVIDSLQKLVDRAEQRDISANEFSERLDALESRLEQTDAQDLSRLADRLSESAKKLRTDASRRLEEFPELQKTTKALENREFDRAAEQLEQLEARLANSKQKSVFSDEKKRELSDLLDRLNRESPSEESRSGQKPSSGESRQPRRENRLKENRDRESTNRRAERTQPSSTERQLRRLRRQTERASREQRRRNQTARSGAEQQRERPGTSQRRKQRGETSTSRRRDRSARSDESTRTRRQQKRRTGNGGDRQRRARGSSGERQRTGSGESGRKRVQREIDRMRRSMRRSRGSDQRSKQQTRRGEASSRAERVREFIRRAEGQQQGERRDQSGRQRGRSSENRDGSGDQPGQSNREGQGSSRGESDRLDDGEPESLGDVQKDPSKAPSRRGAGPSRREIIRSTSNKGFARTEYRDIYAEYEDVAEEVMEREDLPRGYRFYIQRYFELIRPRSASPSDSPTDE